MKYYILSLVLVILSSSISNVTATADTDLEEVGTEELQQLTKDESHVLVLFMRESQCDGPCTALQRRLVAVREELAEALGAWVVRCHAPETLEAWGGGGGDAARDTLVFVRHGVPMLCTNLAEDDDELLAFLLANKDSSVRKLTDETFEHQSQASSGATTGDWLVVFTREGCGAPCDTLMPHVQEAAATLRARKNVAHLHREDGAPLTTRRFGVTAFPAVILFRLGRLYRYSLPTMSGADLAAFAEDTFRNVRAEDIPKPKTPFDDVTQACADWIRENPWQLACGFGCTLLVMLVLVLLNSPPPQSWTQRGKKGKKQH